MSATSVRICAVLAALWLSLHPALAASDHAASARLVGHKVSAALARVTVWLHATDEPEVRAFDGGVELQFAKGTRVLPFTGAKLRQIAKIDVSEDPDHSVITIHFDCNCTATPTHYGKLMRLDIKEAPKPSTAAAKAQPAKDQASLELDKLRDALTARLAMLNGGKPRPNTPGPASPMPGGHPIDLSSSPKGPAAPTCPPHFDPSGWSGKGKFATRLKELRERVATTQDSSAAMADLADFYLFNALAGEAFTVASEALSGDVRPEDHERLAGTGDMARLLLREPPDPSMPAISPDCQAADAGLWRALTAAAAGDVDGIARDAAAAEAVLRRYPTPLLQLIVFRIADAAGDKLAALQAMAGALRNADNGLPEDEAGRFLLQARIARLNNDAEDERAFLEKAAVYHDTAAALIASTRLATLHLAKDGPDAERDEQVLADIARTYRSDAVGQDAAESYAERRLRLGDYASALEIADETAGPASSRARDSRGAALVARILRILLVDPQGTGPMPDPAERLALYWRYEGYGTPGAKGDDIRLGAARLMLEHQVPDAAVDVLRGLSDTAAATDPARLLRARAEATAGDANAALAALHSMPESQESHRAASIALERVGQPGNAAQEFDHANNLGDLTRRAALLFEAKSWSEAATAYAQLLSDAGTIGDARKDAAERYALALALSGGAPVDSVPKLPEEPARLLSIVQQPSKGAVTTGEATQRAIDRARHIENLLGPAPSTQQGS